MSRQTVMLGYSRSQPAIPWVKFSSCSENAFLRGLEGHRFAADLELSEICMALGRQL